MKRFKPNEDFVYYLYWCRERMEIFWNRHEGSRPPYTEDEILRDNKFCNVYRILDRSSQYMMQNVIVDEDKYNPIDMFWRILLYKHFNIPQTWEFLKKQFGDITLDIPFEDLSNALVKYQDGGNTIYSNAYMMTACFMKNERIMKQYGIKPNSRKHEAYLQIFKYHLFDSGLFLEILQSKNIHELFDKIRSIVTVGDFLSYQYTQDLCYSELFNFDLNDLCAAGPGTIRGIERTFHIEGKPDYEAIVKWVYKEFDNLLEDYNIEGFRPIPGWNPQVPDLSNCFCETDKYLRVSCFGNSSKGIKGKRMKNSFKENKQKINYIFPKKWGIKL